MGYSIELKNRITEKTAKMKHHQYVKRGTVRAVMDS